MTTHADPGRADVKQMLAQHVICPEESDPICNHCGDVWPCIVSELTKEVAALRARTGRAEAALRTIQDELECRSLTDFEVIDVIKAARPAPTEPEGGA